LGFLDGTIGLLVISGQFGREELGIPDSVAERLYSDVSSALLANSSITCSIISAFV